MNPRRLPSLFATALRPWLHIVVFAGTLATVVGVHLQLSDAGFRAAFEINPITAIVRGVARLPVVYARVLLERSAAIPVAAGGVMLVGFAWWVSLAERRARFAAWVEALAVAFGIVVVAWFFSFGDNNWHDSGDWQKDWSYYSTLKTAAESFRLPLYSRMTALERTPNQVTERYMANAETMAGPHAILLAFIGIRDFYLLHAMLLAAAGGIGMVALRRDLGMAPFGWALFLIVCFLNGHVMTLLHEGSTTWIHFWLLPVVFLGTVRLRAGDQSRSNAAMLALCMGWMIVNGAFHIFVWSLFVLLFACVTRPVPIRFLLQVGALAAGIGAFRLVPAYLTFGGGQNEFGFAFSGVSGLFLGLMGLLGRDSYFLSWTGVALAVVGLLPAWREASTRVDALRWPCIALAVLSIGRLYELTLFQLPFFVSQRFPLRFAAVAGLGLLLIGCRRIQGWPIWTPARPTIGAWVALACGILLVVQLAIGAEAARPHFAELPPPPLDNLKTSLYEAVYVWTVRAGIVVSMVSAAIAAWFIVSARAERAPTSA